MRTEIDPFRLLSRNTDEYGESGVLTKAINNLVLPNIKSRKRFLDIGSGFGNITKILARVFEKTIVVEPNKDYFNEVTTLNNVKGFNNKWEQTKIKKDKFNLVLAIHLLYYINKEEWIKQIQRMLNTLDAEGKLVITLQSEKSDAYKAPNKFLEKGSRVCSEELMSMLKKNSLHFESYELETIIWVNDKEGAKNIGKFLFTSHGADFSEDKAKALWTNKDSKVVLNNKQHLIICSLPKNLPELEAYLQGSNETQTTVKHLINAITPLLKNRNKNGKFSMLDVGCSDGTFTLSLLKELTKLMPDPRLITVEPEKPAYEEFSKRTQSLKFIKHENTTIQQFLKNNINKEGIFDFIMFSQSFYHFPKKEWNFIIKSANRLLKKNGFVVIVLDSHDCEAYRIKNLITKGKAVTLEFGDLYSAEDMEKFLRIKNIGFKTFSFPVNLFVKNNNKKVESFARHLAFLYRTYARLILPRYEKEVKKMLEMNKKGKDYLIENVVKGIMFKKIHAHTTE